VSFHAAEKINETAFRRIRKGIGRDLDTILSTKGTVGKIAFVPEGSPRFVCSPQTSFWRSLDGEFLLPEFLYYEMQSKFFVDQIRSRQGETDMAAYLSLTSQRGMFIRVPDIETQKKVIRGLSCLDKKVEINKSINKTLEKLAQTIFKSWFVDFDPVKAKTAVMQTGGSEEDALISAMQAMSGKARAEIIRLKVEQPEQYTDLRATADLFPVAMQDSELGRIPAGWQCLALDCMAKYKNGLALQKFPPENEDDCLPVVKIAQLRRGYTDGEENASLKINPECIIDDGDVVFSWSGSLMVDTWCGGKAALNQHLFKVTSEVYPKWLYFHFTRHHLEEFQRIAADKAVTMGHIKREHLKRAMCAVPDKSLIEKAGRTLGNILSQQIARRIESKTLTELRDSLLPQLLSGELNVMNPVALSD